MISFPGYSREMKWFKISSLFLRLLEFPALNGRVQLEEAATLHGVTMSRGFNGQEPCGAWGSHGSVSHMHSRAARGAHGERFFLVVFGGLTPLTETY